MESMKAVIEVAVGMPEAGAIAVGGSATRAGAVGRSAAGAMGMLAAGVGVVGGSVIGGAGSRMVGAPACCNSSIPKSIGDAKAASSAKDPR
jgi:hypothetical protein